MLKLFSQTGECLHVLVGHVAAVRCVQYDGRLVVSGAYDYMVKVSRIELLILSVPNWKKLKADERSPKVWNPEREECLHTLSGHTNRVYSLQVNFNVWVKILTLEWTPHKLLGGTLYRLSFRNYWTGVLTLALYCPQAFFPAWWKYFGEKLNWIPLFLLKV